MVLSTVINIKYKSSFALNFNSPECSHVGSVVTNEEQEKAASRCNVQGAATCHTLNQNGNIQSCMLMTCIPFCQTINQQKTCCDFFSFFYQQNLCFFAWGPPQIPKKDIFVLFLCICVRACVCVCVCVYVFVVFCFPPYKKLYSWQLCMETGYQCNLTQLPDHLNLSSIWPHIPQRTNTLTKSHHRAIHAETKHWTIKIKALCTKDSIVHTVKTVKETNFLLICHCSKRLTFYWSVTVQGDQHSTGLSLLKETYFLQVCHC